MFTAALFTITMTWKQPICPSTDEWIKKWWYIFTIEYYSAIKRHICVSSNEVDVLRTYYKQCCEERWGTCISFNSGFLSVYAQQWDCYVIRQFYFQVFEESPHCSP